MPYNAIQSIRHRLLKACAGAAVAAALVSGFSETAYARFNGDQAELVPDGVRAIIKGQGLQLERVGLIVASVSGEPIVVLNPDKPFNIASVAKIFTTIAGLDVLGYKHRWKTRFYHDGKIENGSLRGNLYLRGEGDPFLTKEYFRALVDQVRKRGIERIEGDFVIDDTHFSIPRHNPNAFDGAGLKPYNVGPSAVLMNFKTFNVSLTPVLGENRVSLHLDPPSENVGIADRVTLSGGRCRNWRSKITERYNLSPAGAAITLIGKYPRRCGPQSFTVSLLDHHDYVAGVFAAYWKLSGGTITGKALTGPTPKKAKVIAAHVSDPLPDIVRGINKFSNNVMARQMFLAMGNGTPKTPQNSRQAMLSWMTLNGIDPTGFHLENGAGLSRDVRATPRQTAETLIAGWQGKWRAEIFSSFPVIGYDGTLRRRMRGASVAGYGRLKTGSLRNVYSVAGMLHHPEHEDLIFVAMANGGRTAGARQMVDQLVKWSFEKMKGNG